MLLTCIALLLSVLLDSSRLSAQNEDSAVPLKIIKDVSASPEGHFTVSGTNSVQNMDLMRWAEDIAGQVERVVGKKLPCNETRPIHLTVCSEAPEDKGRISLDESGEGRHFVQSLRICNYDRIDNAEASAALCRLLLDGYVVNVPAGNAETNDVGVATGSDKHRSVPRWMYRGFARYIYHDQRAWDSDAVLRLWKAGKLKPLPELLDFAPSEMGYPYGAVYGMMIAWMESLPKKDEFLARMFQQLSTGGTLSSEWFTKSISGCLSASDVDEKWENWIIGQWRVVHRLGVATPLQVEQLKEHLVIRQDDVGMPLSTNIGQRIVFRSLIEMKPNEWKITVLKNKISDLKLLGMGKGPDFNDVVDAYCRFLDAVVSDRNTDRSNELLEKADACLDILETKVNSTVVNMTVK